MARVFILCGLLSMGLVCQGQLNYEGNPLTEAIEYTAQESQSSRLNARERFEVADARTINLSKRPFTPSAIDPLTPEETKTSLSNNDEEVTETTIREMFVTDEGSPIMTTNHSIDTQSMSTTPSKLIEPPINRTNSLITMPQVETRQLRQYPMQSVSPGIHRPSVFQEVPQSYHQLSRSYGTPEESPIAVNPSSKPQNSMSPLSKETIDEILRANAEMQLQRLLAERDQVSPVSPQQSVGMNNNQAAENTEPRGAVHDTFDNEISSKYENDGENVQNPRVAGIPNSPNQVTYLTRAQYQPQHLYPAPKWNQYGPQSRKDTFYPGPPMRRYPAYRDPMRTRLGPYAQQRIAPGPPVYLQKGLPYSGPPPLPGNHHWKQPVEVIYKKPPGSLISKHPVAISNPPVAYEDASKWFPESENLPPQKDVYYSQLYAQSYDPHYYNYIAKTGKIKPWLYGKLGKSEEKSIWWELYSGFKNHGMKNMMNPMFLLGMTIPTLTLILSALMQKRSAARAYTGVYDPQEFFEVYEPQIRAAILAYENQMKANMSSDKKSEGLSRRKRSVLTDSNAHNDEEQEKYGNKEDRQEKLEQRSIGPAPPGVSPFEAYFLAHQQEFAQAIIAHEKEQQEKYNKEKKKERMKRRSIGPAPPGVSPFEEYFLAHQEEFAQAIIAYEKEQQEKYDKEKMKETMNNNDRLDLS